MNEIVTTIVLGVLGFMVIGLNVMLRNAWAERDQARAELRKYRADQMEEDDELTDLLDQIDRLDQQATKGPWEVWPQMDDEGVTYPEYIEGPKNDLFGERGWDEKHYIQEIPELTMDDAEFIALARTALPQLAKALHAVMEVHTPEEFSDHDGDGVMCNECMYDDGTFMLYPCPTAQAITDAMGADNA